MLIAGALLVLGASVAAVPATDQPAAAAGSVVGPAAPDPIMARPSTPTDHGPNGIAAVAAPGGADPGRAADARDRDHDDARSPDRSTLPVRGPPTAPHRATPG